MLQELKIDGRRYRLPPGLLYRECDSPRTAMIMREDPTSDTFNGYRVVDAEDLKGNALTHSQKVQRVENLIVRQGGELMNRPLRPAQEFLRRVGIAKLPDDVDITFREGGPHGQVPVQNFYVTMVDHDNEPAHQTTLYAWETAVRPKSAIYKELREILIEYGATPLAQILKFQARKLQVA